MTIDSIHLMFLLLIQSSLLVFNMYRKMYTCILTKLLKKIYKTLTFYYQTVAAGCSM